MERKAIMKTLRIFTGKQKDYNEAVLKLLFDNGPLSAWELTAKIPSTRGARHSLHATLNKRLRALEKQYYIRRENTKWILRLKGFIAVLLIPRKPKVWNPVWKEIYESKAKIIEQKAAPLLKRYGLTEENFHAMRRRIGLSLDDLNAWVELSKKAKSLMENGLLDFDSIKEETLLGLLIMETMTTEQLAEIWEPEIEPNHT